MVQGLESLSRKLRKRIPKAVADATEAALVKGATEISDTAKRLAPRRSGRLADSIGWTLGKPPGDAKIIGGQERRFKGVRASIFAGNSEAYYARFVEFGTERASPHPFFFPAYRVNKKRAKNRITRAIKKGLREGARKR